MASGLLAAGCSVQAVPVTSASPSNYAQLAADSAIAGTLRKKPSFGPLEISGLKKTVLGEPGDWRACLRTMESGRFVYFSVFYVGNVVDTSRRSVAIDRCEQERQFLALPPATPKSKRKRDSQTS